LTAEGRAMLAAAARDFTAIDDVEVLVFVSRPLAAVWRLPVDSGRESKAIIGDDEEAGFRAAASQADFALVVGPEFDGILATRCRWALECGVRLLGPTPEVVELCADKLALARHWEAAGVPTPPTRAFDPRAFPPPAVVKPRFGAGAVGTYSCARQQDLNELTPELPSIVQPYCDGLPMSQSFLIGVDQRTALAPCAQHIRREGRRLHYDGGQTMNRHPLSDRVRRIAAASVDAVPGLFGYVGVDVLIRPDGFDLVLEVNPRLTTSYLGLRELCQQNLMGALLHVAGGDKRNELTWRAGDVRFTCDGATEHVAHASSKRR
jgi:hypothetical protein